MVPGASRSFERGNMVQRSGPCPDTFLIAVLYAMNSRLRSFA